MLPQTHLQQIESRKPPIMAFYLKYNQHIVKTQP